ncbi:MAG: tol-pal system protein YbgF [Pseudomonadota bacterium]
MIQAAKQYHQRLAVAALLTLGWVLPGSAPVQAQELTAQNLNQRLLRLERVLDNSVLIDMVQRMESLQSEVRQLRGELERKTNEIEAMRERQRKLYLDTDGRLQTLEAGGGGGLDSLAGLEGLDDLEGLEDIPLDDPEPAVQQAAIETPVPTSSDREEKLDYQNAYDLLILGRNLEAIAEFENFLSVYPDGTYSDNAHYWLGEANYVERQFDEAIDRFNVVIFQFPGSRKVPDARLRKGFALFELQRYAEARQELVGVESEYRGRSIAALARRRLEQMDNAGI